MNKPEQRSNDTIPLVCKLPDHEQIERRATLAEQVFIHAQHVQELTDGYAFQFPASAEWTNKLVQFITAERICCPFFLFELIFEPNEGPIWLHLRGGAGIKDFVKAGLDVRMASNSLTSKT